MKRICSFLFIYLLLLPLLYSQTPKLEVPINHHFIVDNIMITSDQRYILSVSRNIICIWDYVSGEFIKSSSALNLGVNGAELLSDSCLVIQDINDDFFIWNFATGNIVKKIKHGNRVYNWGLAKQNKTLVINDLYGRNYIKMIDINSDMVDSLQISRMNSYYVDFDINEKEGLLAISQDSSIIIYSFILKSVVSRINDLRLPALGVRFIPNSSDIVFYDSLNIYIRDYKSNELKNTIKNNCKYCDFAGVLNVSTNGDFITYMIDDYNIIFYSVNSPEENKVFTSNDTTKYFTGIYFSPDGKSFIICYSSGEFYNYDINSFKDIRCFSKGSGFALSYIMMSNGRRLYFHSSDKYIYEWNINRGMNRIKNLLCDLRKTKNVSQECFAISKDKSTGLLYNMHNGFSKGDTIIRFYDNDIIRIIDFDNNIFIRELRLSDSKYGFWYLWISPNKKEIYSSNAEGTLGEWDIESGNLIKTYSTNSKYSPNGLDFSNDGNYILGYSGEGKTYIWKTNNENIYDIIPNTSSLAVFSNNSKDIIYQSDNNDLCIWNIEEKKVTRRITFDWRVYKYRLLKNRSQLILFSGTDEFNIVDSYDLKTICTFNSQNTNISNWEYDKNERYFNVNILDGITNLWDIQEGKMICSLIGIDSINWAVVTPEGHFDATQSAMKTLHWSVGLETITLEQLKERYYEPGLLSKLLGDNSEPLRDLKGLNNIKLFPKVIISPPNSKSQFLTIDLNDRGGGIGRVSVLINNKEFISDARNIDDFNPEEKNIQLKIDISKCSFIIKGKENKIEVIAFNKEGYLSSPPVTAFFTSNDIFEYEQPDLHAIIIGISDYDGDRLKLRYSSKDAEDITTALKIGATNLFGAGHTHIVSMTSKSTDADRIPNKENIIKAFKSFETAKPNDILFVYLAGHGINIGAGSDNEDFYYLTKDAISGVLDDPEIRRKSSISSRELTELILKIPALKQVMILDVCGSGKIVDKLSEKRDIPSGQIRAFERMKDRVGLHILTGCAADAISYETSRYGQGLLTYSLLMGIKGAALRDNEYIDIRNLFEFAANKVPELARNIGGIQQPRIFGNESFDIGIIKKETQNLIPISIEKPLILQTNFQEADSYYDKLGISQKINFVLKDITSERGKNNRLIYIDANDFPDAYTLVGRYSLSGKEITVVSKIIKSGKEIFEYTVKGLIDKLDVLINNITTKLDLLISN